MDRLEKGAATVRLLRDVNGGRLTKWKGQLASCAPMVGLALSALVASNPAFASNECTNGVTPAPGATVTCTTANYNPANGDIGYANTDGLILNLDDPALNVNTAGSAVGVSGASTSSADVYLNVINAGTISTTNYSALAVMASHSGSGNAQVTLMNGTVSSINGNAPGVVAQTSGSGDALAVMQGGLITTAAPSTVESNGLYASVTGSGSSTARMEGGDISTSGVSSAGVVATAWNTSGFTGSANAIMTGGTVTTTGTTARAIRSEGRGAYDANTTITNGTVTTSGNGAHALEALTNNYLNAATGDVFISIQGGTIGTTGASAYGASATNAGAGSSAVEMTGGTVTVAGLNSIGLLARAIGAQSSATATITGGDVITQSGNSAGVVALLTGAAGPLTTATVMMGGGSVTTGGASSYGIIARHQGGGVATASMTLGDISTSGTDSSAVFARNDGASATGAVSATMSGGTVQTTGDRSVGVYAMTPGYGDTLAQMDGGTINTAGQDANGLSSYIANSASTATATATLTNGDITTTGANASGVLAQMYGKGGTQVRMDGGSITTSGDGAAGLSSWINNLLGNSNSPMTATAQMDSGTITTSGQYAFGMYSRISGALNTATATAILTNGDITTTGTGAYAVYATTYGLGDTLAEMDGGTINTSGVSAYGLISNIANASSTATVTATLTNGDITTTGADGDGIFARTIGTGTYAVAVNGGSVTSGTGLAAGVRTMATSGGAIDIAAGATIDGTSSGIAIRDGDADHDGVDEIGGDAVVTTAGTVTGDAILGLGDDVLNLTGGVYTGTIIGDDVVASANDGNDTFNWTGGTLVGGFSGQNGSDTALITAATYDGTQILDGGDDLLAADGWVDNLTLQGVTATTAGANLKNWENITVDGSNLTISDGMLETGSDAGTGLTLTNGAVLDAGTALTLMGNMTVDPNSTFKGTGAVAGVYSISGNVTNNGLITTQDGVVGDTLSIAGNYSGTDGLISIDTQLGDDSSPTDQVRISGDASGTTKLSVTNVNGLGAQTTTGIDVVQVGGTSAAGSFALANNVQAGAYQYVLAQGGTGGNPNDWYLVSHYEEPPPATDPDIYRPAVPGYVTAQQDNAELGYATLGTLHQRMGEQQTLKWDYCSACGVEATRPTHQAWARIGGARIDTVGKNRFDLSQNSYFVQIGTDLVHDYDAEDNSRRTVGIMASYAEGHSYFKDRLRPLADLELNTGKLKSTQLSVGGYFTRYAENGSYLDLVGQLSSTRNKFNDIYGVAATQSGLGLGLSAEVGRPWQIGESQWLIEPQAQLSYQHTRYRAFTDEISNIDGFNANSSRGRLGVRLAWNDHLDQNRVQPKVNEVRTGTFYVTANVLQDLMGQESVTIGTTGVSEEMNARPWAELGAGAQIPLNRSVYLYGNVNYQRSLSNENLRHGVAGNIGVRAAW